MKMSVAISALVVALALPGVVAAQGKGKEKDIPASARPPAGMCRIWLDGVPAPQQPAPTDCATAVRNRPAKGRVIFGDDYVAPRPRDSSAKGSPAITGFTPGARKRPELRLP